MNKIREIGATIYLCEGTKGEGTKGRAVDLCNSNKKIILLFLKYLRLLNINEKKLRARIFIHSDVNENQAILYWSKLSKIPRKQFGKTQWRKSSKWYRKRLPYGTFAIRYFDKKTFDKIMGDINKVFI